MQDLIIGALAIVGVCLLIAVAAIILILFRPKARRRRRHKRHSKRSRIDLFAPVERDAPAKPDA